MAERQRVVSLANPIRYIHAECPPVLLMHGALDDTVPVMTSQAFWGDHHLQLVHEFFEWHLRNADLPIGDRPPTLR